MHLPDFDNRTDVSNTIAKKEHDKLSQWLRSIWIREVRRHIYTTTGKPSNYEPGPRIDGGTDIHGHSFKSAWTKLAEFIMDHKLNPAVFIRAQFKDNRYPPSSPLALLSKTAIAKYKTYIDEDVSRKSMRLIWQAQIRTAQNALEHYRAIYKNVDDSNKAVILDDNLSLSALFRYCLAKQMKLDELANWFIDAAVDQYIDDPEAYQDVCQGLIDSDFEEYVIHRCTMMGLGRGV